MSEPGTPDRAAARPLVTTSRQLWYGASGAKAAAPEPGTPELDVDGLDFATVPAFGAQGRTVALLGAWRLPQAELARLDGRATPSLQIVAIDTLTGRVFARNAERRPSGAMGPVGPAGTFGCDLSKHLGLLPERRTYAVFLWLDGWTSPLRVVDVPGEEELAAPPVFTFSKPAKAAPRPASELTITLAKPPTAGGLAGVKLDGRALLAPTRIFARGPVPLTLLALGEKSREIAWASQPLPEHLAQAETFAFELEPEKLYPTPLAGPETLRLIAVTRAVRSNVLTLPVRA